MTVPDYQSLMLPLLKLAADGKDHSLGSVTEQLAELEMAQKTWYRTAP